MEVHSIDARKLHSQLTHLIQLHYGLSSTIITGIPMKEEQNANSSANYDVEIFHLSSTHNRMDYDDITQIRTRKPGSQYDSVILFYFILLYFIYLILNKVKSRQIWIVYG